MGCLRFLYLPRRLNPVPTRGISGLRQAGNQCESVSRVITFSWAPCILYVLLHYGMGTCWSLAGIGLFQCFPHSLFDVDHVSTRLGCACRRGNEKGCGKGWGRRGKKSILSEMEDDDDVE